MRCLSIIAYDNENGFVNKICFWKRMKLFI